MASYYYFYRHSHINTKIIHTHQVALMSCDLYSYCSEEQKNDDVTCYRESFMEIMDEIEDWLYAISHILASYYIFQCRWSCVTFMHTFPQAYYILCIMYMLALESLFLHKIMNKFTSKYCLSLFRVKYLS